MEEISLARFTSGHPDCMSKAPPTFDCREVIRPPTSTADASRVEIRLTGLACLAAV